jgi:hypothetical protein
MVTIVRFSEKPCFLCGGREDAVEVRFKDRSFSGVVCKEHLFQLMKRRFQGEEKAKRNETADGA